jgi:O-antigen/teichoic acid export membrane protein
MNREVYVSIGVITTIATLALTTLALMLGCRAEAFVGGAAGAAWIASIAASSHLPEAKVTAAGLNLHRSEFSKLLKQYGWHFSYLSSLNWLALSAERFVLIALLGSDELGQYVAGSAIASRASLLVNSMCADLFRAPLFAAMNRCDSASSARIFKVWLGISVTATFALAAAFAFGSPYLSRKLMASGYQATASEVMPWVATAYGIWGICSVMEVRLLSLSLSDRLIGPMAVGAVANIVAPYVLLQRQPGAISAAQGTCVAFFIQALATAAVLLRNIKQQRAE